MNQIEREFQAIKSKFVNKMDHFELIKAILKRMCNSDKIWWFSGEFRDIHNSADRRMSELVLEYKLLESRPIARGRGKPHVYRLKSKKLPKWAK